MKYLFFIVTTITLLFFESCNKSTQENTTSNDTNTIQVIVETKFLNNDKIQLFWATDTPDAFKAEKSQTTTIYGKNDMQKLVFELPKNVRPKNLRIDFGGSNPNQPPISIKNITLKYKNDSIDGDNGKYETMWFGNGSMKYSPESLEYVLAPDNGSFDPILMGNEQLQKELIKLLKKRPAEESK